VSFIFSTSPIKQEISETTKPTNEITNPIIAGEPLDTNIRAIPNNDSDTPKSDKRLLISPFKISFFLADL